MNYIILCNNNIKNNNQLLPLINNQSLFQITILRTVSLINILRYIDLSDLDNESNSNSINPTKCNDNKEIFSGVNETKTSVIQNLSNENYKKENKIYIICDKDSLNIISNQIDELFTNNLIKNNTMNLSERSEDKELFSETLVKENTMNLSENGKDKELYSGTLVKENIKITIIAEPCSKGTGASICISAFLDTPETISFILPSDHIFDEDEFILSCIKSIDHINDNIVTFGIKPSTPEINYGYIKTNNNKLYSGIIEKFIEKPNYDNSLQYYKSNEYLWNSGVYIFRNKNVLDCYYKYSNDIYRCCEKVIKYSFDKSNEVVHNNYSVINLLFNYYYDCRHTSFDFSIMEYLIRDMNKKINGYCIKYNSYWNDIGTFKELYYYSKQYNINDSKYFDNNNKNVDDCIILLNNEYNNKINNKDENLVNNKTINLSEYSNNKELFSQVPKKENPSNLLSIFNKIYSFF